MTTRINVESFKHWKDKDPVLADGELGCVRETRDIKLGDGTTRWSELPVLIPGHKPSRSVLENTLYDTLYGWGIIPGSDTQADTIGALGQYIPTDSNGAAVIDEVSYVVSGYVRDRQKLALKNNPNLYDGYTIVAVGNPFVAGDHTYVEAGDKAVGEGSAYYYEIQSSGYLYANEGGNIGSNTVAGTQAVLGRGGTVYPDSLDYSWPFIERFNCETEQWLPRITTPEIVKQTTFETAYHPDDYALSVSGPYYFPAGTLQPIDGNTPSNVRVITLTGSVVGDLELAVVRANPFNNYAADYPAGYYTVSIQSNYLQGPLTYLASDFASEHGGVALVGSLETSRGPWSAEGGIVGVIGGKLYFGGGYGLYGDSLAFFSYDPKTEIFERLVDMPDDFAGYCPYGVIDGRLWYFGYAGSVAYAYDPTKPLDGWVEYATDNSLASAMGNQIHGFEIDKKLWFVYDAEVYVFDPATLTVTYKSFGPTPSGNGFSFLVKGKLEIFAGSVYEGSVTYDPVTNTWAERSDITMSIPAEATTASAFAGVTYRDKPVLLSGVQKDLPDTTITSGVAKLDKVGLDKPRTAREQDALDALP